MVCMSAKSKFACDLVRANVNQPLMQIQDRMAYKKSSNEAGPIVSRGVMLHHIHCQQIPCLQRWVVLRLVVRLEQTLKIKLQNVISSRYAWVGSGRAVREKVRAA